MAILRMDHVSIVVDDLDGAIGFFVAVGMELLGRQAVSGESVDRLVDVDGVQADIAMVQTPDGHGQIELTHYRHPAAGGAVDLPATTFGLRNVMFAVDDLDDTLERLRAHGGELIGDVISYGDDFRLCYLRGPGGALVALAEPQA